MARRPDRLAEVFHRLDAIRRLTDLSVLTELTPEERAAAVQDLASAAAVHLAVLRERSRE